MRVDIVDVVKKCGEESSGSSSVASALSAVRRHIEFHHFVITSNKFLVS